MEEAQKNVDTENKAPVAETTPTNPDLQPDNCLENKLSAKTVKSRRVANKKPVIDRFYDGGKQENMYVKLAVNFFKQILLLLVGYLVCYYNFTLTLPIVAICSLIWYDHVKPKKGERIKKKLEAATLTKLEILEIVKDLPSWVRLPDRERAEWLNEIISLLWPYLNNYIVKYCRGKIQSNIRKKVDAFRFEDIDFGSAPPKVDGIKVYSKAASKDSIIIDFEVFYDGDCDVNFSMSGAQIGRIKDFQMGVDMRVVLKPLLFKMPVIGGIQVFFLNIPDIHFDLEGITGIPGFSYLVRQKIEEIINKTLVFPNKITKRFAKSVEAAELRSIEAEGVLRVHVFEARDLEKKDVTGKSDPYVILKVGAQEFKSPVIKRDLNPQWDYYCEFIILDPVAQQLYFKLFDQDEFNEDDFMGSGAIEIYEAIKQGKTDRWFPLENAKHGKLHLRFSWLALSSEKDALNAATEETKLLKIENIHSALLTVYIDSAVNLPKTKSYRRPDAYLVFTVGNNQAISRTKKHSCNPIWEQGLYLLVRNPEHDSLIVTIVDKHYYSHIGKIVYNIQDLLNEPSMQISKREFELQSNPESKLTMSLQLRILHNAEFEMDESDSDLDEEFVKTRKRSSVKLANEQLNDSTPIPPPRLSKSSITEGEIEKFKNSEASLTDASPVLLRSNFTQRLDQRGRIELSLEYSALRQKFLVTVHRVISLPLKDPTDIPDPYVKLRLDGPGISPIKRRTKVVVDSCDPEYDEKFEYLLSVSEIHSYRLIVTVKNKKMFNSSILGQRVIDLSLLTSPGTPIRDWFDLHEEECSD